jgi:DNA primase
MSTKAGQAHCPFHEDRTPSFVVTPNKNLWHCMGACQTGGSVIDFVMRKERVSLRLACELLLKDLPSLAASFEAARPRTTTAKLTELAQPEEPDHVVLGRVVEFYAATLKESPEALAYLESRGLVHAELIDTFRLGFANRTLGYRLPPAVVKSGAAVRGQLQRLGVLRKESGHEHFNGSLVIPVFDEHGHVVEMYGRKITPKLRAGTPNHLYLPGPHRGIFNRAALGASEEIILCESPIDALTFWCAGYRNVTSAYGVEGFTEELRIALFEHGVRKVLIAYDADDAGNHAAKKLAPRLESLNMEVFRVKFPKGMDANEYARLVQPASKSLDTALRAAEWMAGTRPVAVAYPVLQEHVNGELEAEAKRDEERARAVAPSAEPAVIESTDDAPGGAELAPDAAVEHEDVEVSPSPASTPSLAADLTPEPARADEADETLAAAPGREDAGLRASMAVSASRTSPPEIECEAHGDEVTLRFGDRKWRVRGLSKNLSHAQLKVNVLVARGASFFVDQLELNSARQRAAFLAHASKELELEERVLKADLGRVFLRLEELQDEAIAKTLEPKARPMPEMSESERADALALLRDPRLLDRISEDFERAGVVGEETNKLVGYLAAVSRKLTAPLGVVIQSSSAAGKSSLMDAILSFVPEEERVQYSAMTGQSLYYMGEADLQHKILAIAEEEGASNAAYALKLLQSEGELTIASTGKDPASGRLVTQEYRVTGPVMVMMTTTALSLDEELLNRCLVLTVDDGREQTRAIHDKQREAETLEGMLAQRERFGIMKLHQNAQRLLKPLMVVNPFAKELRFADHATRTRRDHKKYLTLIRTIALLHQHQREVKEAQHQGATVRYIEVTREDIAVADRLCAQVLRRSMDELSPQTRNVLGVIDALVTERAKREGLERSDVRFTQREVRERMSLGLSQLKAHLGTLVEHEYLAVHRGGHAQRHHYELCASATQGERGPFEGDSLEYDANRPVEMADQPAAGRRDDRSVFSRDGEYFVQPAGSFSKAHLGGRINGSSHTKAESYSHPAE